MSDNDKPKKLQGSDSGASNPTPYIWWNERRPGYWYSKEILLTLRNFRELLKHYTGFGSQDALPLSQLLPKGTTIPSDYYQQRQLVEKQITHLIIPVHRYLYRADVDTGFIWTTSRYDHLKQKQVEKSRSYDIIRNFFDMFEESSHDVYVGALRCVEEGIGVYELRRKNAKAAFFNPLHWLATIVRIPLSVAERANLITTQAQHDLWSKVYLTLGTVLLASAIAKQLGLTIPWDKILPWVKP